MGVSKDTVVSQRYVCLTLKANVKHHSANMNSFKTCFRSLGDTVGEDWFVQKGGLQHPVLFFFIIIASKEQTLIWGFLVLRTSRSCSYPQEDTNSKRHSQVMDGKGYV